MTTTVNRPDSELTDSELTDTVRREVQRELSGTDARIEVTVQHGAVTLAGVADKSHARQAELVALTVPGVRAVAQEIVIWGRTQQLDVELARAAVRARTAADVPETVRACVTGAGRAARRGDRPPRVAWITPNRH